MGIFSRRTDGRKKRIGKSLVKTATSVSPTARIISAAAPLVGKVLKKVGKPALKILNKEAQKQQAQAERLKAEGKSFQSKIVPFSRPGKAVSKFGADVVRALPRAITSVGLEPAAGITSLATGRNVKAEYTPKGVFQRMVLGNEPIKGIFEQQKGVQETLGAKSGGSKLAAGLLSAPLIAGMTGLDLVPGGGSAKKVGKEALEQAGKGIVKEGIERGFVQSAKELIPEAKKIAGQYIPRSTDELAMKAKNLIKDNFAAAEKLALTGSDDAAVATASELLKKYADDAAETTDEALKASLYDKAAEIANTLAPKLTEQGRAIQAASILGRLTPEGQVRFAAREIQRFNETTDAVKGGLLGVQKKIPELTGEQAKEITDKMKAIEKMEDGVEKAMEFQKLQNYIQDLVPTPLMKKITTVWKAGLLTGLKTHGVNIFSNLSHGITEVVKDVPATVVDKAASLFTGKRTKALTVRGTASGVKEGFEKGIRYLKTGFDERNIAQKMDYKRVNFGKGPVGKAFKGYTEAVFRTLGASDQPFYYGALSRSLMDQATAQGINQGLKGKALKDFAYSLVEGPTDEMMRYAVADATTAVFQNKTRLGEAASKVQEIPVVGEIVLPFGRTPSAVAMQIVNYSPVGIAKTIIENIGKGKFDQRAFSQGIGRGLTGTAIIAIGVELAKKGLVSLDYPLGDEREQGLQQAEGMKNNAIKIGDKWRSPAVLGPAGNLLLLGGQFHKYLKESGSPSKAFTQAAFSGLDAFTEGTFLEGMKNALNAITDRERYAKSYFPNLLASLVPTIVSDVARATDPLERRPETTGERVAARIPGLREGLEPQIDVLGRERESVGNPLEILFDPTRPSPTTETPVTEELRRLTTSGFDVAPTVLGDRQGYDVLSQDENTELWQLAGEVINDKLTSLFSNAEYQSLSDDEKADIVEDVITKSKDTARASVVLQQTEGLEGEELSAKLSELKDGGFMTQTVFKLYEALR